MAWKSVRPSKKCQMKCLKTSKIRSLTWRLNTRRSSVKPCSETHSNPRHLPRRTFKTCSANIQSWLMSLSSSRWTQLGRFKRTARSLLTVLTLSNRRSVVYSHRSTPSLNSFCKRWCKLFIPLTPPNPFKFRRKTGSSMRRSYREFQESKLKKITLWRHPPKCLASICSRRTPQCSSSLTSTQMESSRRSRI